MKQSERLLVYLVTGFLAVILVVAVVFGREPARDPLKKTSDVGARNLDEMFVGDGAKGANGDPAATGKAAGGTKGTDGGAAPDAGASKGAGLPTPGQVTPEQPLIASAPKLAAAEQVNQQLGVSRRDRTVRFVHAKANDSLATLVRRWCGASEPFLAEARSLNEELGMLHVGQEVAVPWVDDDVLLATLESQKPRTLLAENAVMNGVPGGPEPASSTGPTFQMPGANSKAVEAPASVAMAGSSTYTVKANDSLWKIAATKYGRKNADRMIPAIKAANPGMTDRINVDQKIVLPAEAK